MKTFTRHCLSAMTLSVFSLLLAGTASAQRDFSDVEVTAHHVAGTYYYLEGAGGNVGISVGDDGVVMIDDQFAPMTDKLLAAIRELSDGEIKFLINTHVHGDHTGGNENLGRMGIMILARDEVRVRLAETMPDVALPVLTFSEDITIHANGEEVSIITLPPAHTDGDSYIYFRESDVLHAGDAYRTTSYPFIDLATGGSLDGTIDALGIAIGLSGPNTKIVPGHGVVSTREDVIEFRDMLIDVTNRVQVMVDRGMNLEQIAAANPTAPYDAKWGDPARMLQAIFVELNSR